MGEKGDGSYSGQVRGRYRDDGGGNSGGGGGPGGGGGKPDDLTKLFVGGLPWKFEDQDLKMFFGKFGDIESAKV